MSIDYWPDRGLNNFYTILYHPSIQGLGQVLARVRYKTRMIILRATLAIKHIIPQVKKPAKSVKIYQNKMPYHICPNIGLVDHVQVEKFIETRISAGSPFSCVAGIGSSGTAKAVGSKQSNDLIEEKQIQQKFLNYLSSEQHHTKFSQLKSLLKNAIVIL
jgi:hypothetical protein